MVKFSRRWNGDGFFFSNDGMAMVFENSHHHHWWNGTCSTIGSDGFSMVFPILRTNGSRWSRVFHKKFTPVLKIFYTAISAISVTLCNSAGHTQIIWVRWRLCPFWWEGGRWSPLFERKNGNRKCRIPNFENCLTAETGNPTQQYNRKCRISILRNT